MTASREIQLAARPVGEPKPSDFELAEVEVAARPGERLVRNRWMSVDPYMCTSCTATCARTSSRSSIGAPLEGGAARRVVAAETEGIGVGRGVVHQLGWR